MPDQNEIIQQLSDQLAALSKKHVEFSQEIYSLRQQLAQLQSAAETREKVERPTTQNLSVPDNPTPTNQETAVEAEPSLWEQNNQKIIDTAAQENVVDRSFTSSKNQNKPAPPRKSNFPKTSNLEKWVGENLINKIGILITVIGIGIGAKYSIENNLISPLTRIILGYLSAIGLMGFGIKLKKNYEPYSAVLVSGSIVTMYFITFFAYSLYGLIPQLVAFVLMVCITGFTIVAALNYNKQIIAHLGLVGAYAVPFLLSDDTGRVGILFSYILLINVGVLILAFKKYWKSLYYSAFGFTWLIYVSWFFTDYSEGNYFLLALCFLFLFHILFYLTFLAYKVIRKEVFATLRYK